MCQPHLHVVRVGNVGDTLRRLTGLWLRWSACTDTYLRMLERSAASVTGATVAVESRVDSRQVDRGQECP